MNKKTACFTVARSCTCFLCNSRSRMQYRRLGYPAGRRCDDAVGVVISKRPARRRSLRAYKRKDTISFARTTHTWASRQRKLFSDNGTGEEHQRLRNKTRLSCVAQTLGSALMFMSWRPSNVLMAIFKSNGSDHYTISVVFQGALGSPESTIVF